jgi:RHS repeat-associated protein
VPYKFTGKELDEETGLYYYGARYYDPRTSVWQSPDPILEKYMSGEANGGFYNPLNLRTYSYSYNNPVNYSDPDGNVVWFVPVVMFIAKELASEAVEQATGVPMPTLKNGSKAIVKQIMKEVKDQGVKASSTQAVKKGTNSSSYVDLAKPERRKHILDGDSKGGGHKAGTGKPGKSEFPSSWSDDKVMNEVSDIATDPSLVSKADRGRKVTSGTREGIDIKVVQEKNGDIVTAYPTNTPKNPKQ